MPLMLAIVVPLMAYRHVLNLNSNKAVTLLLIGNLNFMHNYKLQMVVDEMNILTTTFLKNDGEKIYYPNSVLALKPIGNLYRSPPMSDSLEFAISLRTPMQIINDLQDKITK